MDQVEASSPDAQAALRAAVSSHPRRRGLSRWVYPVLSRRSGGLSIGINLNPDRVCNYDCPYCQVDRRGPAPSPEVDPDGIDLELRALLAEYDSDGLAADYPGVPAPMRKLSDVALSGDGEPTLRTEFPEICARIAALERERTEAGLGSFARVLITNATLLDRPAVRRGLDHLCQVPRGEVWGKLDAGTQEFHHRVNVSRVSLDKVTRNLAELPARYPMRIQTLFFRWDDLVPGPLEIQAWIDRLETILRHRPLLSVQLHTVARATSREGCHPLAQDWLEAVASSVRTRLGLDVDVHPGQEAGSLFSKDPSP